MAASPKFATSRCVVCPRRIFRFVSTTLLVLLAVQHGALAARTGAAATARQPKTKLLAKYYDIKECDDRVHFFRIHNVSVHMDQDGGDVVDADGAIEAPIKILKMLTIIMNRCSGISSDTCEYFLRWNWSAGLCQLAVAKGMMWTPFVDKVVPAFKCPLPAGKHYINNASLDLTTLDGQAMRLNLDKYIWRIQALMLNERDDAVICFNGTFEVRRVLIRRDNAATATAKP